MTLADIAYDAGRKGLPLPLYAGVAGFRAWERGKRDRFHLACAAAGISFQREHLGQPITADEDARISADGV